MRIEKRAAPSRRMQLAAPLLAIAFTLLFSSLLVAWAGAPVGRAYALLLEGGFGSTFAWSETLTRATPLILTGLSAAVAFRARLFNIGAEGQLYAGALAAVAIGGLHGGEGFALHPALLFPAMMAAAAPCASARWTAGRPKPSWSTPATSSPTNTACRPSSPMRSTWTATPWCRP